MTSVDLNADLAEFDNATNTALLAQISSANICCGVHSGDPLLTYRTIERAKMRGVSLGAHPSYPDRANFGRTSMRRGEEPLSDDEMYAVIGAQLAAFAALTGGTIAYVKPHGALYNDAQVDSSVAAIVAHCASQYGAAVVGQPGSVLQREAETCGLRYISEAFADRGYDHDGRLIDRGMDNAVLTNPSVIAARVVRMVTEGTVASWGYDHDAKDYIAGVYEFPAVDSVCLHGDTHGAYQIAVAVREALTAANITIASPLAVTR